MDAKELGERVRDGVLALRGGDAKAALDLLSSVVEHPEFQSQDDMAGLFARVLTLVAQCHLALNEPKSAQGYVHRALKTLKQLEDADGIKEVQSLNNQILSALIQHRKVAQNREALLKLAEQPIDDELKSAKTSTERADILIEKANAMLEAEDAEQAVLYAEQGLTEAISADSAREIVLAWLTIARADPTRADLAIREAWSCANHKNEFNLISMIVATASSAGVSLPSLHGPGGRIE